MALSAPACPPPLRVRAIPPLLQVLLATNRPDTLDPALLRPGRVDRRIQFELPDLAGRERILRIHSRGMSLEGGIRWAPSGRWGWPLAGGREERALQATVHGWRECLPALAFVFRMLRTTAPCDAPRTGLSCWRGSARPPRAPTSARCALRRACLPSARGGAASQRTTF